MKKISINKIFYFIFLFFITRSKAFSVGTASIHFGKPLVLCCGSLNFK